MRKRTSTVILGLAMIFPLTGLAAGKFYYAGWLPFWRQQSGALDIAINLDKLDEVSPFSYEVGANGTLKDQLKIKEGFWPGWLKAAKDSGVKVIPTIAWFDGGGIHALLSDTKRRRAHEDLIAKLVRDNKFDGIDIDYESKMAKTKDYFSTFLKGLALRLHPHNKILSCTVEARTPLSSLENSNEPQKKPSYANDYAAINKYCDEVRIMTYDQGVIDLKLDSAKGNGKLYVPVADAVWVEKVVKEAIKTINRKKIMLGVPTYGYEYQVDWRDGITTYRHLRSLNFFTAMNRAEALGINPVRNNAGELAFVYTTSTFAEVSKILRWDVSSTMPAEISSSSATAPSSAVRYASFSDAESANQKIKLAKKYGLRGVAFFKFDGEFDPLLWQVMK